MAYKHDIFISYRRVGRTYEWVTNVFIPVLNSIISLEIGRDAQCFVDKDGIDSGSAWPLSLGQELGCSKTLISLWSVTYLQSEWCKYEISHMLEREIKTGFKTQQNVDGLVFPTIIHDGENIPLHITFGQRVDIRDYFSPFMDIQGKAVVDLYNILKPHGKAIARSIQKAPPWQQDWGIEAQNEFYKIFSRIDPPKQDESPKFS